MSLHYELTGNFQYDIGVLGLKLALDTLKKEGKELNYKYSDFTLTIHEERDEVFKLLLRSLLSLSEEIESKREKEEKDKKKNKEEKDCVKVAKFINNYFLNFYNPSKLNKLESIDHLAKDIYQDFNSKASICQCSFCNATKKAIPINRMYFLFAPSSMNSFYNNKPSIFICEDCLLPVIASPFALANNSTLVYVPNLSLMESWHTALKDEKNVLKKIVTKLINENHYYAQIVEYRIDSKKPSINIFPLGKTAIENMKKRADILENLLQSANTSILKDVIYYIATNQSLFTLILKYVPEIFQKYKNDKGSALYSVNVALLILKLHLLLTQKEVTKMEVSENLLEEAKKYGESIHGYIWRTKKGNTAVNYSISLASALIQSIHLPFTQALENLIRISITTGKAIPFEIRANINKENYREVLAAVALSIMSFPEPKEEKEEEKEEAFEESLDD